ncbi:phosphoglycerate kinase [Candidatus Woesearchaeota archaeon]|nr:phosphoglycerate kinase [Candidatus Woesearchaeota archaeon]
MESFNTLRDIDFKDKRVLVRVDFNVPIEKNKIADDTKIRAALPTIKAILKQKPEKIILMSHLGRPGGKKVKSLNMDKVAKKLSTLLKKKIKKVDKCFGIDIQKIKEDIIMLENLRFYPEEEKNSPAFAKKIADLGDVYVNDAFAVCHREHASVSAITNFLPSCAGLLLEKELKMYQIIEKARRPFIVIIGGAKLETKIPLIKAFVKKADYILLGSSTGKHVLDKPENRWMLDNKKIIFPEDYIKDLDIGKKTIKNYNYLISTANTICWNGPLGMFEKKKYEQGTRAVAKAIARNKRATTLIGGGSTEQAAKKYSIMKKVTHVSTGGGASLLVWQGAELPGVKALQQSYRRQQHL